MIPILVVFDKTISAKVALFLSSNSTEAKRPPSKSNKIWSFEIPAMDFLFLLYATCGRYFVNVMAILKYDKYNANSKALNSDVGVTML
ncbi:unnamed protein product [Ambrosiozyma monospora]|uniref:Unnamed protein product n=1 Tax=Ambrosiozyma monospora TaxID=43982 RepID=A0ACB5TM49_AMBMO|nr:unnamed protein product [Ambrosiozyma monospora]